MDKIRFLAPIVLLLIMITVSCQSLAEPQPQNEISVNPNPKEYTVEVTLYFAGPQAMYVMPEQRTIVKSEGESLAELIIKELIKGPKSKGLGRTIPESTKVLSVDVNEGVAYVNFSKEIKTKHPGGSAGEIMTIASVVNSLTEIDAIEMVQFLVEGKVEESIWGHIVTDEPKTRMEDIIKKQP